MAITGNILPVVGTRMSDAAILAEVGERLRRERLDRNLTVTEVATRSGISERTIRGAETGSAFTMSTLLALLRTYGLLSRLEELFPERGPSPIQLADRQGVARQRASRQSSSDAEWEW